MTNVSEGASVHLLNLHQLSWQTFIQPSVHFLTVQEVLTYFEIPLPVALNVRDFLSLSGLFDAVQPLDDSGVPLHRRDAVGDSLSSLLFLLLLFLGV